MATVDLVMPKMGESIMEATILKWHKAPGDPVKMDETVLEIATDKVDSEVPSTAEGVLAEVLFHVNEVVPVGAVIARIRTGAEESGEMARPESPLPSFQSQEAPSSPVASNSYEGGQHFSETRVSSFPSATASSNGSRFYSPLVLNIAAQEGISLSELEKVSGTGNEGRVTKRDILQYVSDKRGGRTTASRPEPGLLKDILILN